jgi:ABC-2 type transport system ATP-binding protein
MNSADERPDAARLRSLWGATDICVTYGNTRALSAVTLRTPPGVVTAIVGGDGAGKTTLLRCLAGSLAPDSGNVTGPGPLATGYFPPGSGTYPDLTVAENLAFRASAYGVRGAEAAHRAADLMERAGLADARDRLASQLSGGMRHKLGVIAAMVHRPDLLVLDEPSTGVDPVSRSGLWLLITTAAADGAAVVLSTTYLDDAQRAGSVLVLDNGRQLAAGTPEQIVADMPGAVLAVPAAPVGPAARLSWRRGVGWRIWSPPSPGARGLPGPVVGTPVAPDLQDAVTVASIARELASEQVSAGGAGRCVAPAAQVPAARHQDGMSSATPLAECRAVTCRFGQFTAVHEVSIGVRPGEIVGLLGANGAGKTTLIRMLLGLQRPTSGHLALFGELPSRRTRRQIGYVPQGLGLYDDLTAAENMEFAAAVFGIPLPDEPDDLAQRARVPVGELPLGLQRRAAFAEALSHRPSLLVLDEPTSGVDTLGRARLWDTIAKAARAGAGVLVSTHYMEEAWECDRLVILAGGVVVAGGTADQIIGGAQVTVVETQDWATAFRRLGAAGMPAALAGRTLRVPGFSVDEVRSALAEDGARLLRARATLEERFFQLVQAGAREQVPA